MAPPRKYGPLVAYLAALPAAQPTVTLTFAELERLCGPLSWTARVSQSHWQQVSRRRVWGGPAWSARLDAHAESVTFTRR